MDDAKSGKWRRSKKLQIKTKILYEGWNPTIDEIAIELYGDNSYLSKRKSYQICNSLRRDLEPEGLFFYCTAKDSKYKVLHDSKDIADKIAPNGTRVTNGYNKLHAIRKQLEDFHPDDESSRLQAEEVILEIQKKITESRLLELQKKRLYISNNINNGNLANTTTRS